MKFVQGDVTHLLELGLTPGTFDLTIASGVVHSAPDVYAVLAAIRAMLKEGGEFQFADVFFCRRLTPEVMTKLTQAGSPFGVLSLLVFCMFT